jgi:hypothetical protein
MTGRSTQVQEIDPHVADSAIRLCTCEEGPSDGTVHADGEALQTIFGGKLGGVIEALATRGAAGPGVTARPTLSVFRLSS